MDRSVFFRHKAEVNDAGFRAGKFQAYTMPAHHQHNDIELNLVVSGQLEYLFGNRELVLPAGSFALFWAAMPHHITQTTPDAVHYYVHVPTTWFLSWQLAFTQAILNGSILVTRAVEPADVAGFHQPFFDRLCSDIVSDNVQRHIVALLEVEALVRRMAVESDLLDFSNTTHQKHGKAAQMARFIAEHYCDSDLCVQHIADAVGIKPNSAMKLFRRHYTTTLIDYLTRYRVAHAQNLLITTDAKIIDIAFEVGFSSSSRFYAAFKQITGTSPGAYRSALESPHVPSYLVEAERS